MAQKHLGSKFLLFLWMWGVLFWAVCYVASAKEPDMELNEVFPQFDTDDSGYIEWEELKYMMQGSGEPTADKDVAAMMTEVDKDGDGRIDYEEFVAMKIDDHFYWHSMVAFNREETAYGIMKRPIKSGCLSNSTFQ